MKPNNVITDLLNANAGVLHGPSLIYPLLEHWAARLDFQLENRLLRSLVLKYALAERELAQLNDLKNRFLGIAAHDLRNPLSSTKILCELMLTEAAGTLTDDQREFITTIYEATEGMLLMVNDFLDLSAIESGKLQLRAKRDSLKRLTAEHIRRNRVLAERKGVELHESLAEVPDTMFDPNKIGQVIDNLINNAIKFSPVGSKIEVTLTVAGPVARLSVLDEGPGIDATGDPGTFSGAHTAKSTSTGETKSMGLGLAIARRIVTAHGGTLNQERRRGAGSVFSFTLPLADPGQERSEEDYIEKLKLLHEYF